MIFKKKKSSPHKTEQLASEMLPKRSEMLPQPSEMVPRATEMIPQLTEMVPRPTEMAPHAAEMIKQHCGTISVADYSNNASFFINFHNEIIF